MSTRLPITRRLTRSYADPRALEFLVEHLRVPLHADVPIERIDVGGARHD
jgi:hypothetical protein